MSQRGIELPLIGSIPAAFPSAYSLEVSVNRLREAVQEPPGIGPALAGTFRPGAFGKVSENKVAVYRIRTSQWWKFSSAFPVFYGRWRIEDNRVVLAGRFTRNFAFKGILLFNAVLWCIGIAVLGTIGVGAWWTRGSIDGAGMFVCSLALAAFVVWLIRKLNITDEDVPWLTRLLENALARKRQH